MTRLALAAVIALSLALAACAQPDVALGGGGDGGAPAPTPAQPPTDKPFVQGRIMSVAVTTPVTTDCVSEADLDGDGAVSSDDPPVCDPNPSAYGSIHVKGTSPDQGGKTEMVATIERTVPIARRSGGGVEPIEFADLSEGDTVSLWVEGPVMESYPLQGGAHYVLVED